MVNKIICVFVLAATVVTADDYISQRGMTNLLGVDTNLRCSQQMSNPKAKTYELSYKLSLIHI